jgi:Arm DNA-binding domain
MAMLKLTQGAVDRQPYTSSGTRWFHDTELRGFALAVGMATKTYYASCEANGRTIRRKIARADVMHAAEARRRAAALLVDMRAGRDPRQPIGSTLAEAFETYLQRRHVKPSTARQYREAFELHLKDWLRRPIAGLTRAEVDARHRHISRRAPYYPPTRRCACSRPC